MTRFELTCKRKNNNSIDYTYRIVTNCKTVGELINDIECLNKVSKNKDYIWSLHRCFEKDNTQDTSLKISSYWNGDSRDHSKYDSEKIFRIEVRNEDCCPIEVIIVINPFDSPSKEEYMKNKAKEYLKGKQK